MVKFGGKIGTLYQMLKNAFKKHPLQNRTNVQIKGMGVKGLLNNVQKNCTFLKRRLPLVISIFICCRCSGPCQRRKDSEMPPGHRSELNQHLRICWEYAYCAKLSLSFFDRTNRTNLQKIVFCFTWKTFTLFTKQLGLACQSDQMIIR